MRVCVVSLRLPSFYEVTETAFFGGAEVQAAFVADALRTAGADVVLVVADLPAGTTLPHPAECAFFTRDGLPVLRFFHPRWSGIMEALERANADVYHQHCAGMITGLVARFCRRNQRTFVYGAGSDADFQPGKVVIDGARDRLLYRYGLRNASGIVVQNREQLAAAQSLGKPLRLIPTGARLLEPDNNDARELIVWIGSLWTLKRPDLVLELARRLPDRKFAILGGDFPSEADYSARIRAEAARLPNVTITGRIPNREVEAMLRRAALLINTSDVEGFPNAYLEAWSLRVPVVARHDIDGIIAESGAGMIAENVEEMVSTVRKLEDDGRRRAMGEAARRLALDRFSPARLGADYMDFFAELRARHAR
ncbi:MAG TPA: glycosyltransferase family 4 protein [Candidatus Krumholzibacteria bacterium]|nr:glycosyltransferase family 4 protein [Candidatus Krumholzibacteria bacterium]